MTKPCQRVGCEQIITAPAFRLARRKYCSASCSTRDRIAHGWIAHAYITPEARSRGAKLAGKVSGEKRHKAAMTRAVADCAGILTPALLEGLTARQIAAFRVAVARAYLRGEVRGAQKTDTNRRYWQQVAEARQKREAA